LGKSESETTRWRELGNQSFKIGKDVKAMEQYSLVRTLKSGLKDKVFLCVNLINPPGVNFTNILRAVERQFHQPASAALFNPVAICYLWRWSVLIWRQKIPKNGFL
jgi:hypothetical protein